MDPDQIEPIKSIQVYDPVKKCHFRISIPHKSKNADSDNEEEIILEEEPIQNPNGITIWTQQETLALINLFAMYKDKSKGFRNRKSQWKLISKELAKNGIYKTPEKCDSKWRNLLRVYRQHVQENKGRGKFEFFNEIDSIVANDPRFRYVYVNSNTSVESTRIDNNSVYEKTSESKKRKCSCSKSDKQKRHDDRVALLTKKLEIEERKVKAFEDYLHFLKSKSENV